MSARTFPSESVSPLQSFGEGVLAFANFELDVTTGELRREGRLIHLRPQAVAVLRLLLERAGALVTRYEITNALWPEDLDVDVEQGLNHCMKEVRAALNDRAESPRFIQTLPRRGYRFLGGVYRRLPRASVLSGTREASRVNGHAEPVGRRLRVHISVADTAGLTPLWTAAYEGPVHECAALEAQAVEGLREGLRSLADLRADKSEEVADTAEGDADGDEGEGGDPRFE